MQNSKHADFSNSLSPNERAEFLILSGLPKIVVSDGHLFLEQLMKLDPLYDSLHKLELFRVSAEVAKGVSELLGEAQWLVKTVIEDIKATPTYSKLNQCDFEPKREAYIHKALYHHDNVGRSIISIDLKKANWQVLRLLDFEHAVSTPDYEMMISKYTNLEFLINSKKIRQQIIGRISPQKIEKMQSAIMSYIMSTLLQNGIYDGDFISLSQDEITIANTNDNLNKVRVVLAALSSISFSDVARTDNDNLLIDKHKKHQLDTHLSTFRLNSVLTRTNKPYYFKANILGEATSIHTVPYKFLLDTLAKVSGNKPTDVDLAYENDGKIHRFNRSLFDL